MNKNMFFLLVFILLISCGRNIQMELSPYNPQYTIVPLTIGYYGKARVEASINGVPVSLIVDTGMDIPVMINEMDMEGMEADIRRAWGANTTIYGTSLFPRYFIADMAMGGNEIEHVRVDIEEGFLESRIGMGVLSNFNLLFNYYDSNMVLMDKSWPIDNIVNSNWIQVPFTGRGHIEVPVYLEPYGGIVMTLDSGAYGILFDQKFCLLNLDSSTIAAAYSESELENLRTVDMVTLTGDFRFVSNTALMVSGTELGGLVFLAAPLTRNVKDGLLTDQFFFQFPMLIDNANQNLYLYTNQPRLLTSSINETFTH